MSGDGKHLENMLVCSSTADFNEKQPTKKNVNLKL